jgi:hypothetical protein
LTEFEDAILVRLDRLEALLQRIADAVEADRGVEIVGNGEGPSRGRWNEVEAQNFAAIIDLLIEIGLTAGPRLTSAEIVARVGDRSRLRQVLTMVAGPRDGAADVIDVKRLGKYLSDRESWRADGWQLVADRSNKRRPRWYLIRPEGFGE